MGSFDQVDSLLKRLVSEKHGIPGAVLIAMDKNGETLYANSVGTRSLEPNSPKMTLDTVFWMASFTKLVTVIAVMQCVERGLLFLDDPVGKVLPEYAEPKILKGYTKDGEPVLELAKKPLTLRHLLTHSSGLSYDLFDPTLKEWSQKLGRTENQQSGTLEGITYPLLFEPGQGWKYSVGLDWAGQMVERVKGNISLEDYFQKNIFQPLHLTNTTFRISQKPDLLKRLAIMSIRKPDGSLDIDQPRLRDVGSKIFSGGSGLYGTGLDYARILAELVKGGGVLLKPETVEEMFKPQLEDPKFYQAYVDASPNNRPPYWGDGGPVQYGLSFMMNMRTSGAGRSPRSAQWSGSANTYWWADYEKGVVGVVMAQIMPFGDSKVLELHRCFEEAVYSSLK